MLMVVCDIRGPILTEIGYHYRFSLSNIQMELIKANNPVLLLLFNQLADNSKSKFLSNKDEVVIP